MIIAIDGYEANIARRVGIGRYAYEMLVHLFEQYKLQDAKGAGRKLFRIYLPSEPLSDMPPETSWWQYRVIPFRRFWTWIGLPICIALDSPHADIIFSPTHYIPRFIQTPKIMAIMDTSYLEYPELFRKEDLYKLVHWTAFSASHSARILTISQFSKNAIIQAYGVLGEHVVVTYPGMSNLIAQNSMNTQGLKKKYFISDTYLLSVGTLQPRKNFERTIEAFAMLLKSDATIGDSDLQLVIVGKKGWLWDAIVSAPARFGIEKRVRFLDFVPDEDLPALYAGAQTFVLASLYEGFGLPVLEAMAHGCPVVVSNISSLPEIAGDAGIYVDPESVQSISEGIAKSMSEKNKTIGKERVLLGKKRVSLFSWKQAAKQALEVFDQVGGSHQ